MQGWEFTDHSKPVENDPSMDAEIVSSEWDFSSVLQLNDQSNSFRFDWTHRWVSKPLEMPLQAPRLSFWC